MKAAVYFEAIAAVPVTALLDKLVRFRKVRGDELVVTKEEADADKCEDDVYPRTQTGGLFEGELLGLNRLFLYIEWVSDRGNRFNKVKTVPSLRCA